MSSSPFIKISRRPATAALPTFLEPNDRGQIRVLSGDGATTKDKLYFGRDNAGTGGWAEVQMVPDASTGNVTGQASSVDSEIALFSGTGGKTIKRMSGSGIVKATSGVASVVTAPSGTIVGTTDSQTLTNKTLTSPAIADYTNAQHIHLSTAGGGQMSTYATFGPFFTNDLASNATVDLQAGFFDTATTLVMSTMDVYMPRLGEIVGIFAMADANRVAGTATLGIKVNGSAQTFDAGGTCVLDATNTRRHAVLAASGDGENFNAGDRVSLTVTTASWGPTTANLTAFITVRFDY